MTMLALTFFSNYVLQNTIPKVSTGRISGGTCGGVFYEKTVPFSALFMDKESSYLFEIVEKDTPLGKRYYLNRVNAVVLQRDYETKTAGIASAAELHCRILTDSEEEVEDKEIVRPVIE